MTENPVQPSHSGILRWLRHIVIVACLLGFLAMLAGVGHLLFTGAKPGGRDIVSFWVAGRQTVAHANPYDAAAILALENAAGFPSGKQALIMRNPPYALPLVLPLGPLSIKAASLLWSVLLIASLALSLHLLWVARGRPQNKLHLLGYTFAPALTCILGGQTAIFALLGLTLFFCLYRRHGFAAGMSLWLCALKPHLFLPFAVVFLLWTVAARRYRPIAGATLALAATSALGMWLVPSVWAHYFQMMRSANVQAEFVPCISYALRALHPRWAWLQYLPAIAGCGWGISYYLRRRKNWTWMDDGTLLMLVSVAVAPYSWVTDDSVLIPALLAGVYCAATQPQLAALAVASLLVEIAQLTGMSMHSPVFILAPLYWLAWYLYARWQARLHPDRNHGPAIAAVAESLAVHSL